MTIKEIAKLANVSPSTISRVVNNSGYVKSEVREKIEKLIEETGYRPNAYAKALLQNKSHTIGVIIPKINSSSSADTVAGIDEFISARGYTIIIGNANHNVEREIEIYKIFQEKMVDGIIILERELTQKQRDLIKKSGIPTIILGQESFDSTPCVVFDDMIATQELTDYLIERGRKDIAYIGVGENDIAVGINRKEGFFRSLKNHGLTYNETYIGEGDFSVESGYEVCKKIMKESKKRPEAIIAVTDIMAIGAMRYLFEIGLEIPKDIAVVGMGGGYLSKYYHPQITTSKYNYKNMGIEGAKLLYEILNENRTKTRKIVMSHELVIGESS